ncbi:MAG: response regulator [Chitinophagales bacterium]
MALQAIEQAKKHQPHLIILDVMMPNMDGVRNMQ